MMTCECTDEHWCDPCIEKEAARWAAYYAAHRVDPGGYDADDPKHPEWADRLAEEVDS